MKSVKEEVDEWEREQKIKKSLSQKEWYKKNKDDVIEKSKAHYQKNKQEILKKGNQIIQCPLCRCMIKHKSLSHHKKTEKCKILTLFNINV